MTWVYSLKCRSFTWCLVGCCDFSLIGAIIIVFGLYSVVWGKSKDPLNSEALTFEKGKTFELPVVDIKTINLVDDDAQKSKFSGKNALSQQT